MLSKGEIDGLRDLLTRLEEDVVFSIADTTTKKAIAFTTLNEAVDAILLHSESANWLLNRKRLTRAMLFEYLNAKRVPISGQADKSTVISKILELWSTAPQEETWAPSQSTYSVVENVVPHPQYQATVAVDTLQSHFSSVENVIPSTSETPEMGLKFAQWFYEILLAVHRQTLTGTKLSDQFWKDVRMKVTMNSSDSVNCQEALGSEEVANLLQILLCQHGFLLNPNLSFNGIRERKNPHGMVVVGVCGTAHQYDNCSGIFEQVFGLLQDPSADFHWKIKWSELRITQAAVNRLPCVNDLPELQAICDNSAR